jgi:hypothetical protein
MPRNGGGRLKQSGLRAVPVTQEQVKSSCAHETKVSCYPLRNCATAFFFFFFSTQGLILAREALLLLEPFQQRSA